MWLVRLLARDPTFPRPVKIGRLRFFVVADLEAWERKTAAESRAA
jgi:predicted DNA-binding transcriptional regulator AlpA